MSSPGAETPGAPWRTSSGPDAPPQTPPLPIGPTPVAAPQGWWSRGCSPKRPRRVHPGTHPRVRGTRRGRGVGPPQEVQGRGVRRRGTDQAPWGMFRDWRRGPGRVDPGGGDGARRAGGRPWEQSVGADLEKDRNVKGSGAGVAGVGGHRASRETATRGWRRSDRDTGALHDPGKGGGGGGGTRVTSPSVPAPAQRCGLL